MSIYQEQEAEKAYYAAKAASPAVRSDRDDRDDSPTMRSDRDEYYAMHDSGGGLVVQSDRDEHYATQDAPTQDLGLLLPGDIATSGGLGVPVYTPSDDRSPAAPSPLSPPPFKPGDPGYKFWASSQLPEGLEAAAPLDLVANEYYAYNAEGNRFKFIADNDEQARRKLERYGAVWKDARIEKIGERTYTKERALELLAGSSYTSGRTRFETGIMYGQIPKGSVFEHLPGCSGKIRNWAYVTPGMIAAGERKQKREEQQWVAEMQRRATMFDPSSPVPSLAPFVDAKGGVDVEGAAAAGVPFAVLERSIGTGRVDEAAYAFLGEYVRGDSPDVNRAAADGIPFAVVVAAGVTGVSKEEYEKVQAELGGKPYLERGIQPVAAPTLTALTPPKSQSGWDAFWSKKAFPGAIPTGETAIGVKSLSASPFAPSVGGATGISGFGGLWAKQPVTTLQPGTPAFTKYQTMMQETAMTRGDVATAVAASTVAPLAMAGGAGFGLTRVGQLATRLPGATRLATAIQGVPGAAKAVAAFSHGPLGVVKGVGEFTLRSGATSGLLSGGIAVIHGATQPALVVDVSAYSFGADRNKVGDASWVSGYVDDEGNLDVAGFYDEYGEVEATRRLALAGAHPEVPEQIYEQLPADVQALYSKGGRSMAYEPGFLGAYGRGADWMQGGIDKMSQWIATGEDLPIQRLGGKPGSWAREGAGALAGGMAAYYAPHGLVSSLWPEKGGKSFLAAIPHFGPTAGYTALTWDQQPWYGKAAGIGFAALPLVAGPAGAVGGKLLGRLPGAARVGKAVDWIAWNQPIPRPITSAVERYSPWRGAWEIGKVIPKYGPWAYKQGWLGPKTSYATEVKEWWNQPFGRARGEVSAAQVEAGVREAQYQEAVAAELKWRHIKVRPGETPEQALSRGQPSAPQFEVPKSYPAAEAVKMPAKPAPTTEQAALLKQGASWAYDDAYGVWRLAAPPGKVLVWKTPTTKTGIVDAAKLTYEQALSSQPPSPPGRFSIGTDPSGQAVLEVQTQAPYVHPTPASAPFALRVGAAAAATVSVAMPVMAAALPALSSIIFAQQEVDRLTQAFQQVGAGTIPPEEFSEVLEASLQTAQVQQVQQQQGQQQQVQQVLLTQEQIRQIQERVQQQLQQQQVQQVQQVQQAQPAQYVQQVQQAAQVQQVQQQLLPVQQVQPMPVFTSLGLSASVGGVPGMGGGLGFPLPLPGFGGGLTVGGGGGRRGTRLGVAGRWIGTGYDVVGIHPVTGKQTGYSFFKKGIKYGAVPEGEKTKKKKKKTGIKSTRMSGTSGVGGSINALRQYKAITVGV